MTRDDERDLRFTACAPRDDVAEEPPTVNHDGIARRDLVGESTRDPQWSAQRMLDGDRPRSLGGWSADISGVEESDHFDTVTSQRLAPTSRSIRRPGLTSEELLLIVDDPQCVAPSRRRALSSVA